MTPPLVAYTAIPLTAIIVPSVTRIGCTPKNATITPVISPITKEVSNPAASASAITPATTCGGLSGPKHLGEDGRHDQGRKISGRDNCKVQPSAHERDHHGERKDSEFRHLESHSAERFP